MLNSFLHRVCCIWYIICLWLGDITFQTVHVEGKILTGFLYHHLYMVHHLSIPPKLPVKTVFIPVHHLADMMLAQTLLQLLLLIIRYFSTLCFLSLLVFPSVCSQWCIVFTSCYYPWCSCWKSILWFTMAPKNRLLFTWFNANSNPLKY